MAIVVDRSTTTSAVGCRFDDLQVEFLARGFDYLGTDAAGRTRAKAWINAARAELDRMFLWPWREQTVSGTPPLAISDLGPVQQVYDTSAPNAPLQKVDRQTLVESYGDLTIVGSPAAYYVDWSSGARSVATYPTTSNAIGVRYWRIPNDLVDDADTTLMPKEVCPLIVDLAVRRAYRDSDNHNEAEAVQAEVDRQIDSLLFQYEPGVADGPDGFVGVGFSSSDW